MGLFWRQNAAQANKPVCQESGYFFYIEPSIQQRLDFASFLNINLLLRGFITKFIL